MSSSAKMRGLVSSWRDFESRGPILPPIWRGFARFISRAPRWSAGPRPSSKTSVERWRFSVVSSRPNPRTRAPNEPYLTSPRG